MQGTKHLRKLTPQSPHTKAQQGVSVRKCSRSQLKNINHF